MTPEQTELIKQSWKDVVPIADTAARLFYDRLFEIDPSTAELFVGVDMEQQRNKLVGALSLVVDDVDELERLIPVLQDLGRRHTRYGVSDHHYDSVGTALLWTLEQGLGPAFTAETRSAWTIAYATVAGVMREAGSHQPVAA
jgi:hemoglobin-like flavoprotein